MDVKEIVMKLNGHIVPYGESHVDAMRYQNLKELGSTIISLIDEITEIGKYSEGYEHSVKVIVKQAKEELTYIQDVAYEGLKLFERGED